MPNIMVDHGLPGPLGESSLASLNDFVISYMHVHVSSCVIASQECKCWVFCHRAGYFWNKIFTRGKFKFRRTKIWKITIFESLCKFKISIISFEITFIVCSCHFYKDVWEVEISSEELPLTWVRQLWRSPCSCDDSTVSKQPA